MSKTFSELSAALDTEARQVLVGQNKAVAQAGITPVVANDLAATLDTLRPMAVKAVLAYASPEFDERGGTEKNTMLSIQIFQYADSIGRPISFEDARMLAQQAYNAVAGALT